MSTIMHSCIAQCIGEREVTGKVQRRTSDLAGGISETPENVERMNMGERPPVMFNEKVNI